VNGLKSIKYNQELNWQKVFEGVAEKCGAYDKGDER